MFAYVLNISRLKLVRRIPQEYNHAILYICICFQIPSTNISWLLKYMFISTVLLSFSNIAPHCTLHFITSLLPSPFSFNEALSSCCYTFTHVLASRSNHANRDFLCKNTIPNNQSATCRFCEFSE